MTPELQAILLGLWQVLQWPLLLLGAYLGLMLLHHLVRYVDALAETQKFTAWYKVAYMLVQSAEQTLPDDANDEKFDFVRSALRTYFPSLTEDQIKQLVESAVLEMNNALKSLPEPGVLVGLAPVEAPLVTVGGPGPNL